MVPRDRKRQRHPASSLAGMAAELRTSAPRAGFLALCALVAGAFGDRVPVSRPKDALLGSRGHVPPPYSGISRSAILLSSERVGSTATLGNSTARARNASSTIARKNQSAAIALPQPTSSRSVNRTSGAMQSKTSSPSSSLRPGAAAGGKMNTSMALLRRGPHARAGGNHVSLLDDGAEDYAPLGTSLLFTNDARVGASGRSSVHAAAVTDAGGHGLHLGNSTLQSDAKKQKLTPQSWFAITFSFAFVVKCLCMLSNVVFQVSPLPQVLKFNEKGDTFETDAAPFMSILYGGCQWCFYGFFAFLVTQKSGFLVLVYSNVMGAVLGSYYIWVFQSNCLSAASLKKLHMYYQIAACMVLIQVCAMAVLARQRALFFCGLVSSVCSVVGACSLLATLPTVLETKSSKTINKPVLCAGFLGAILWALCGFILWDPLIMVPNLLCMCFQTVAFGLVLYFPNDGPPSPGASESSPLVASIEAAGELGTNRFLLQAVASRVGAKREAEPKYGTLVVQYVGETGGTG